MQTFLIWTDLVAYSGSSFSTSRHSHFYTQLCLGNNAPFRLRGRDGGWRSYTAAFIPSGVSHQTEQSEHPFTILLLDPLTTGSEIFGGLKIKRDEPAIDVSHLFSNADIQEILELLNRTDETVRNDILKILERHKAVTPAQVTDKRILNSIGRIQDSKANMPLAELANDAGISPSRFRHLFREETGIAFSAYRLWMKTRNAILFLSQRPDLALAAYEGGFADQAHFSRIFRRSFGMSPSGFSRNDTFRIQIFGS